MFELLPDRGPTSPPGEATRAEVEPPALGRAGRATAAWLRRRTAPQVVAGVAALALAVGGLTAAAQVRERAAAAALVASPGGVFDLGSPVHELWSRTFDVPDGLRGRLEAPFWPVGVLDADGRHVVVFRLGEPDLDGSAPRAADPDTRLVGLDLDTGAERWQVPIDGVARCGVSSSGLRYDRFAIPTVAARLVCTTGEGIRSRVVVVEPDGTAVDRTPGGLASSTRLLPGPGGVLVRVDQTGPDPDGVALSQTLDGGWRFETGFTAPGHRIAAVDPRTGEELWHAAWPGAPVEPGSTFRCASTGPARQPRLDVAGVSADVSDDGMVLRMCGGDVVLTASGTVVAATETGRAGASVEAYVRSLAGGGIAVARPGISARSGPGALLPTVVYDRDGREVMSRDSGFLDPMTTDGRDTVDLTGAPGRRGRGVLLAHDGLWMRAVTAGGDVRWTAGGRPGVEGSVAQAGGVLALVRRSDTGDGELVGIDLGAGVERWTVSLGDLGIFGGGRSSYVRGAWTDGRVLVVIVPGFYGSAELPEWVAYDLRSGERVWHLDADATARTVTPSTQCIAVAGRLLCLDSERVARVA